MLHNDITNKNQDLPSAAGKKQSPFNIIKQPSALLIARFSEARRNTWGLNNMVALPWHRCSTVTITLLCSFYWFRVHGLYPVWVLKKLKWTTYAPFGIISKVMAEIISNWREKKIKWHLKHPCQLISNRLARIELSSAEKKGHVSLSPA